MVYRFRTIFVLLLVPRLSGQFADSPKYPWRVRRADKGPYTRNDASPLTCGGHPLRRRQEVAKVFGCNTAGRQTGGEGAAWETKVAAMLRRDDKTLYVSWGCPGSPVESQSQAFLGKQCHASRAQSFNRIRRRLLYRG
jgi:hypothetical protein